MVECTECGAAIVVPPDVIIGEIVSCKDCSSEYEVVEITDGIILRPAEQMGEDWGE